MAVIEQIYTCVMLNSNIIRTQYEESIATTIFWSSNTKRKPYVASKIRDL